MKGRVRYGPAFRISSYKFNKNRFRFSAAIESTPPYLTGTWNISVDLKALQRGDLTTSNVTGYYLETNVETGESEVLTFRESFDKFLLEEVGVDKYRFRSTFALNNFSDLTSFDADLWYIHGRFTSISNNTYEVFKGWVSYKAPDDTPSPGAPVPEPATMFLVSTGVICLAAVRRRRKE